VQGAAGMRVMERARGWCLRLGHGSDPGRKGFSLERTALGAEDRNVATGACTTFQGSANEKRSVPAATAKYCFPATA
jgi:hypothetical protein